MKTTLCIPTHTVTNELLETVNNYFLSFQEDPEIVIVLDGGEQGPLLRSFDFLGESLKVIELDESHGPAFARNLAADNATGDVLIFVDSDVVIHPPVFMKLSQVRSGVIMVPAVLPMGVASKSSRFFSDFAHAPKSKDGLVLTVGACFALHRKDFLNQGGFNAEFRYAAGEDWEFFRRVQMNGLSILFSRDIRVFHLNPRTFIGVIRRSYRYARYGSKFHDLSGDRPGEVLSQASVSSKRVWIFLPEILVLGGLKIVLNSLSIGNDFFERACLYLQNLQETRFKLISHVAFGVVKKSTRSRASSNRVVYLAEAMIDYSTISPWESVLSIRSDLSEKDRKSYRVLVLAWQLSYIFGYIRRERARAN